MTFECIKKRSLFINNEQQQKKKSLRHGKFSCLWLLYYEPVQHVVTDLIVLYSFNHASDVNSVYYGLNPFVLYETHLNPSIILIGITTSNGIITKEVQLLWEWHAWVGLCMQFCEMFLIGFFQYACL